jgi:hypothetical protein
MTDSRWMPICFAFSDAVGTRSSCCVSDQYNGGHLRRCRVASKLGLSPRGHTARQSCRGFRPSAVSLCPVPDCRPFFAVGREGHWSRSNAWAQPKRVANGVASKREMAVNHAASPVARCSLRELDARRSDPRWCRRRVVVRRVWLRGHDLILFGSLVGRSPNS